MLIQPPVTSVRPMGVKRESSVTFQEFVPTLKVVLQSEKGQEQTSGIAVWVSMHWFRPVPLPLNADM